RPAPLGRRIGPGERAKKAATVEQAGQLVAADHRLQMRNALLEGHNSVMGCGTEIVRPGQQRGVIGIRRRHQIKVARRTIRRESIVALTKLQSSSRHDESIPREKTGSVEQSACHANRPESRRFFALAPGRIYRVAAELSSNVMAERACYRARGRSVTYWGYDERDEVSAGSVENA